MSVKAPFRLTPERGFPLSCPVSRHADPHMRNSTRPSSSLNVVLFVYLAGGLLPVAGSVWAGEYDSLKPRVPVMERPLAKLLKAPFGPTQYASPQILEEGQEIYEGKGTCIACHGEQGTGNGVSGRLLHPPPRDFTDCQFQKHRSDGELFWILQNGSPGTGMIPMIPVTITEEEAWKVIAYERSFCNRRR